MQWVLRKCKVTHFTQLQSYTYGHSWTEPKCISCCVEADRSASVDHCLGGRPCSFHCQDPSGDKRKLYERVTFAYTNKKSTILQKEIQTDSFSFP